MELVIARPFPKVGVCAVTSSNDLSRSTTPISWEAPSVHSMASYSSEAIWVKLTVASQSRSLSLRNIVLGYENREGVSRRCRVRLTLKRYSQLTVFVVLAVDLHLKEAVWLNEDNVNPVGLLLAPRCSLQSGGGSTRDTSRPNDNRGTPGKAP